MNTRMPAIFFGHGNPMNALERNSWTAGWAKISETIPRPQAILCISAHWYIPTIAVTAMEHPRTIHDFGGFPKQLFEVQYPAAGSPELAERVTDLLGVDVTRDTTGWGLDHGTWSVLCHVYPNADVPVVQLSIEETQPPQWHFQLAQRLRPLRDEDVLIIGSGNLVHNLHAYAWGDTAREPFDWALQFEQTARDLISTGDFTPLANYEQMGKDALLSAPTPEHFLPLLYVLAQHDTGDDVTFPVEGFDGGAVSMLSVKIG